MLQVIHESQNKPRWFRIGSSPWMRVTWQLVDNIVNPKNGDGFIDLEKGLSIYFNNTWYTQR